MSFDIFKNPTKGIPKSDSQVVRVNMEELEIAGRKSHLPKNDPGAPGMSIRHVSTGGKN